MSKNHAVHLKLIKYCLLTVIEKYNFLNGQAHFLNKSDLIMGLGELQT